MSTTQKTVYITMAPFPLRPAFLTEAWLPLAMVLPFQPQEHLPPIQSSSRDQCYRDISLKGKDIYVWPPCA